MMKTLEKSKFLQKLTELYFPSNPQSRRRMSNTMTVIGVIAFVLLIVELVQKFS